MTSEKQPSPYSGESWPPPGPNELDVRLTVEAAIHIVEEIGALKDATILAPGQTPNTDKLVATLVVMVQRATGVQLVIKPTPLAAPAGAREVTR